MIKKMLRVSTVCFMMLHTDIQALSLTDVTTSASEISNSLGEVNTIITQLNGFDLENIIRQVDSDNALLECLASNVNISDIIGQIPTIDGICGQINISGLSDVLDNPIARCAIGSNIDGDNNDAELQGIQDMLNSFCSINSNNGNNNNDSNGWGNTGNNSPSVAGGGNYSPVTTVVTSIENENDKKPLDNKKYLSGMSVADLYGGNDGGKLYKKLKENPDSDDAMAIKKNNIKSIFLKELALKLNGTTDESSVHLPKNKLEVIKQENSMASLIAIGKVDYGELKNFLIQEARKIFKTLNASSLNEYEIKEKQAYFDMLKNNTTVVEKLARVKENAMRSIGFKYEMQLTKLKGEANYIPNTSYTVEKITKKEYQDEFKFNSFMQMNRETIIKTKMAEEKRVTDMRINQTIQDAYYLASIFRADIAKKEIDAILKTVDTAIK